MRQLTDTEAQAVIDRERRRVAVVDAIADKIIAEYVGDVYHGTYTGQASRSILAIREAVAAGYMAGKADQTKGTA